MLLRLTMLMQANEKWNIYNIITYYKKLYKYIKEWVKQIKKQATGTDSEP